MISPDSEQVVLRSENAGQTRRAGQVVGERMEAGDVIALCGPLGAGKTEFAKGIAAGLDVPEDQRVTSPTFVLIREYGGGRLTLFHIDAYRLAGDRELVELGFEEICELPGAVVAIEWADRVGEALPPRAIRVELEHADGDRRLISVAAAANHARAHLFSAAMAEVLPQEFRRSRS